jgi:hypothetical protein
LRKNNFPNSKFPCERQKRKDESTAKTFLNTKDTKAHKGNSKAI